MKILVPVDGSPFTKRMLAYLVAHDEWLGSAHEYTLLHAVSPLPTHAVAVLDRDILKGYYEDSAERVLKPIRAFFAKHPSLKATFASKTGYPPDVIAQSANKGGFDLIIMGSHGHGSLTGLVMGSVATKVIAQCKLPVLLVR